MKTKTTKDVGKELENYVLELVKKTDPKARLTKGSGCATEIGDVLSTKFFIECKKRNKKNLAINEDTWVHLLNQLPYKTEKVPLYVLENINKRRFVVLNLEDFFRMVKNA